MTTETLDKLFLEWSLFTKARTFREIAMAAALYEIATSNPNRFEDPAEHANWAMDKARAALEPKASE